MICPIPHRVLSPAAKPGLVAARQISSSAQGSPWRQDQRTRRTAFTRSSISALPRPLLPGLSLCDTVTSPLDAVTVVVSTPTHAEGHFVKATSASRAKTFSDLHRRAHAAFWPPCNWTHPNE